MRYSLFILLIFCCLTSAAQSETVIRELIEDLETDLPDDFDLSEFTALLEYYYEHPIDLNSAKAEELNNLIFLSAIQIRNLLAHIAENGRLLDVMELQGIEGFNVRTIERLILFAVIRPESGLKQLHFKSILSGNHDLILRYSKILEQQKGFKTLPGSRYLGTPYKALLRYSYKTDGSLSVGLTMEKDAGEDLIALNKLPDHLAGNISFLFHGKFKKLILGDYSLQFGQGLTLWSGFSFGKGADVATLAKKATGLKPYASANEYSFLRGIASTIAISKKTDLTAFVSCRNLDGSLSGNDDNATLSTVSETGLHRTANELKNRASLRQFITGGTLQYNASRLGIGFAGYYSNYKNSFVWNDKWYTKFNFTGNNLINLGANYTYSYRNFYFFGEAAHSVSSGIAHLNGVLISISSFVSASLSYRNYQKDYHNFFTQAIAEGSGIANEKGFFAGLNITPNKRWLFALYTDRFRFPWLKFRIDAPSEGYEWLTQITYTPSKTLKFSLRYKSEQKEQNTAEAVHISFLETIKKESCRFSTSLRLNKQFGFQSNAELSHYRKGPGLYELGYAVYQDAEIILKKPKLTANVRIAYFNTPSYDSRIYAYERDVLYGFNFGMYNGKGYRGLFNFKYRLIRKLDLWGRYAILYCPDRLAIGSGLDEIQGNKKQEVKIQLRYQF